MRTAASLEDARQVIDEIRAPYVIDDEEPLTAAMSAGELPTFWKEQLEQMAHVLEGSRVRNETEIVGRLEDGVRRQGIVFLIVYMAPTKKIELWVQDHDIKTMRCVIPFRMSWTDACASLSYDNMQCTFPVV